MDNIDIRWMIRRDMPSVLAIEQACFDVPWSVPWSEEEFITAIRQSNCIGMVAYRTDTEQILGFMVYTLQHRSIDVLDLAVAPEHQRHGIGTAMIDKLIGKLSETRRSSLRVCVSERNTPTHLFLRAMGGRADAIWRDQYEGCADDMYEFVFRYGQVRPATRAIDTHTAKDALRA